MPSWERMSEPARKLMYQAQDEARLCGSQFVLPEHILLALLRSENEIVNECLKQLGCSRPRLEEAIQKRLPAFSGNEPAEFTLAPPAKNLIEIAFEVADSLGDKVVTPLHFFIALPSLIDVTLGQVFDSLGIKSIDIRRAVFALQKRRVDNIEILTREERHAEINRRRSISINRAKRWGEWADRLTDPNEVFQEKMIRLYDDLCRKTNDFDRTLLLDLCENMIDAPLVRSSESWKHLDSSTLNVDSLIEIGERTLEILRAPNQ